VVLALGVAVEQAAQESHECDALELRLTLRHGDVLLAVEQGLEAVRVAQCLGREGRDRLAEADVGFAERLCLALGAEEDRADDGTFPADRDDDDRADVAEIEMRLDAAEHRVVRGVGDEHRLAALERALELRIAIEVDDEIADRRILVAGDEADFILVAGEEDGAAIEAEGLAELAGDGLEDVDEVERRGDFLEDVDDCGEVVAFARELRDAVAQPRDVVSLRLRLLPALILRSLVGVQRFHRLRPGAR